MKLEPGGAWPEGTRGVVEPVAGGAVVGVIAVALPAETVAPPAVSPDRDHGLGPMRSRACQCCAINDVGTVDSGCIAQAEEQASQTTQVVRCLSLTSLLGLPAREIGLVIGTTHFTRVRAGGLRTGRRRSSGERRLGRRWLLT